MSLNGVNKVILLGRAGQQPEVKFTSSGKHVATFSLAINESFKKWQRGETGACPMGALRGISTRSGNLRRVY